MESLAVVSHAHAAFRTWKVCDWRGRAVRFGRSGGWCYCGPGYVAGCRGSVRFGLALTSRSIMLAGRALETNGYRKSVPDWHQRHRGTRGAQFALAGHPPAKVSRSQIVTCKKKHCANQLGEKANMGDAEKPVFRRGDMSREQKKGWYFACRLGRNSRPISNWGNEMKPKRQREYFRSVAVPCNQPALVLGNDMCGYGREGDYRKVPRKRPGRSVLVDWRSLR